MIGAAGPAYANGFDWTTSDEQGFVSELGLPRGQKRRMKRRELLREYIAASERRAHWGNVSAVEVVAHAQACLYEEEKRTA